MLACSDRPPDHEVMTNPGVEILLANIVKVPGYIPILSLLYASFFL